MSERQRWAIFDRVRRLWFSARAQRGAQRWARVPGEARWWLDKASAEREAASLERSSYLAAASDAPQDGHPRLQVQPL